MAKLVERKMLGINGDGKRLNFGSEHIIYFTDDALQNCILENYIIVINQCNPNTFNKTF